LDAERRRIDSLRPLPGAGAEGDAVARALGVTSTTLTRRRATEREVRTLAPTRRVLHFATHAVASDTEPMDSFLALAGSSSQPSEDGRLTAEEVYGLSLDADLVVLSGCRTASGQITGDGVVGLSRAFFVAGTPSIVASLWDLPDAAGEELLPRFYRQWSRSADKADALRQAQLQMLERMRTRQFRVQTPAGPIAVKPHPAVWAGLVLLGEP
jgi:CHAT domain-containing protein